MASSAGGDNAFDIEIKDMIKDFKIKLRVSTPSKHDGESREPTVTTTSSSGDASSSAVPCSSTSMAKPWETEKFQFPRRGTKDVWDCSFIGQNWLVREHRKERVKPFGPLHRSLPIDGQKLTGKRISVVFFRDHSKKIIMDDFHQVPKSPKQYWCGFSFFELRGDSNTSQQQQPSPYARTWDDTDETGTDGSEYDVIS